MTRQQFFAKAYAERVAWCKRVDPVAYAEFQKNAESRRRRFNK